MLFCYWNVRGLGSAIRNLLRYVEADYEDIDLDEFQPDSFEKWYALKPKLELDFPNLPYFIDGDLKLTQVTLYLNYPSFPSPS